ncbi:unnamed protein product [Haemonchus placei]|uniref:Uncharacterized protein n=1 Tax=Haemonchus placei TaxID=6290 RepID=A0A3P8BQ20_HAEPC|nr:unnamed protein product [Haemonchus placei]
MSVSGNLSAEVQSMVTAPIAGLVLFQIATAMLLIIGVLIDTSDFVSGDTRLPSNWNCNYSSHLTLLFRF